MLSLSEGIRIAKIAKKSGATTSLYFDEKASGTNRYELGKHIRLESDRVFLQAPRKERDVILVTGMSGLGKSTWVSNFAALYKGPIYLFSRKDYDPAYDGLNIQRINIGPMLITEPIDPRVEFENSLVICDDYETIADERIKNAVKKIILDIVEVGRDRKISLIMCNHCPSGKDHKFDRPVLNELTSLVVFKNGLNPQLGRVFKDYFAMSPAQIRGINNMVGRWISLSRWFPYYILTDKECRLV